MILLFSVPGGYEFILIFAIIATVVMLVSYISTLQSTLEIISPENRKMKPGNVWLLLIPLFGIFWHFSIVINLSDSIKAEAASKNITLNEARPGYNIGMANCILNCLVFIPVVNIISALLGLVCWIIYWVKIARYKSVLLSVQSY